MICGIIGLPSSGKSLVLSYLAYRAINGKSINFHGFNCAHFDKHYQRVYTNFPFEKAYQLDFDALGYAEYNNCLMLTDELQMFADSRNFKNFGDNLKFFFSQHRKFKIDFIYATQSPDTVDKRIRSLTDKLYYIDRTIFNLIRIREIQTYFDIHNNLSLSYEYSSGLNSRYFYAPRLYKYNDTYGLIHSLINRPAPSVQWSAPSEPSTIGTTTLNGKEVEILTDGNAYYKDDIIK